MTSSNLGVRKILLATGGEIRTTGSKQPVGVRELAGEGRELGGELSKGQGTTREESEMALR